ncbi:MAG: hypothetical protein KKF16_03100 [Euryarchaeota archaeon]|nr:hypothetical protein [Euryarchaeota archaeon]MBV1730383.1 hypothetical protein [Methanobacterium sp.]MBU4547238.1 hypothetical protein [Euryarchaeota archaeon]MBU4608737.1 hypothetical protein [Euryarchaeota archaeon]MBV1755393.1 hypothetical protein [Methanobacterium sp.]
MSGEKEKSDKDNSSDNNRIIKKALKSFKGIINTFYPDLDAESIDDKKEEPEKNNQVSSTEASTDSPPKSSEFALLNYLYKLEEKFKEHWQNDREKIIKIAGISLGSLFIIAGALTLLGSSERVIDNVVFGERSVIAAFFIIIGFLIIAGSFAQRIASKTSLDNLYREVKIVEEKPKSKNNKDSDNKKK